MIRKKKHQKYLAVDDETIVGMIVEYFIISQSCGMSIPQKMLAISTYQISLS